MAECIARMRGRTVSTDSRLSPCLLHWIPCGRSQIWPSQQRRQVMARSKQAEKDAIALLKADHRQVEEWFEQFEKARDDERKQELATRICNALKVHTTIEEEIFYPAFLEATDDKDLHHEAEIEHDGAKNLIAQIEESSPDDEYFDSKVKVLSEM